MRWQEITEASFQDDLKAFQATTPIYDYQVVQDSTTYKLELKDNAATDWYFENAGHLRLSRDQGIWKVMSIHVDNHHRGRKAAEAMLKKAVGDLGPMQTSGVFSDAGKGLFSHLASKGQADALDGGKDFLIHF
jgi:hypothetical protein